MKVNVTILKETEDAEVLVGTEGLVWVQPALGNPYILGARNDNEKRQVVTHIAGLLRMGLVPYGMPVTQRVNQALFGGSSIRDCQWVKRVDMPAPKGEPGDTLPTQVVVVNA